MRRSLYWLGVLAGAAALVAGALMAWRAYQETSGPDGAVRGYFAALARSDAAQALAFGDLPDGPRTLLTADVLREQQRIAPIRQVQVGPTSHQDPAHQGTSATVQVDYVLAFAQGPVEITVPVGVHRAGSQWRLDRVAVSTELLPTGGRDRESIIGAPIPSGPTLLFPGALPVQVDTPYLQLDAAQDNVSFDALSTTGVFVQPTVQGRSELLQLVRDRLRRCLSGPADPACPQPSQRYVPGSIRGSIVGDLSVSTLQLDSVDPAGKLTLAATATINGTFRKLDFANRQVSGRGHIALHVDAAAYAVAPLTMVWS